MPKGEHGLSISLLWSRAFLTNRYFLWLLFICNLVGTVYGYVWYGAQLRYTWEEYPGWLLVFVPDSPTASLFFCAALLFLLYPPQRLLGRALRAVLEALAVVTSVKYGVWASAIIFAGAAQGGMIQPTDWMLVASHTIMAVEVLLYVRFFTFGAVALALAAGWTFLNDTMDYTYGIFPWLPATLHDHVPAVRNFTFLLTLGSVLLGGLFRYLGVRGVRQEELQR